MAYSITIRGMLQNLFTCTCWCGAISTSFGIVGMIGSSICMVFVIPFSKGCNIVIGVDIWLTRALAI